MGNRDLGWMAIPAIVAVALLLPIGGGNPMGSSAPRGAATTEAAAPETAGTQASFPGRDLLREYFGLDPNQPLCGLLGGGACGKIQFIIATVPDPLDSRLAYSFDRYIDAIERAMEADGFVLDRFDFPWREKPTPGLAIGDRDALSSLLSDRQSEKLKDKVLLVPFTPGPGYRTRPGSLLFRGLPKGRAGELLQVFLVGETPTAGVHKEALLDAFHRLTRFWDPGPSGWHGESGPERNPCAAEGHRICLLGPSFSGSADSFEIAFKDWLTEDGGRLRPEIRMYSGAATAIDKDRFISLTIVDPDGTSRPVVRYRTTVLPDAWARRKMTEFLLTEMRAKPEDIVLISEGTSYGRQGMMPVGGPSTRQEEQPSGKTGREKILRLTFPLHIAELRRAAVKPAPEEKREDPFAGLGRSSRVPLTLQETSEPTDVPPLMSGVEAASIELVLSNLLSTISREKIRYVGLFTTDVRDRVFLAGEIREHCPNVRLFTFASDLLYLHSSANPSLQGMLVLTPYPLFSLNQIWSLPSRGDRSRLQFPNQSAQGVYNAALALLGAEGGMLEYGAPFASAGTGPGRPSLWLMTVGRDALWPVNVLPGDPDHDVVFERDQTPDKAANREKRWRRLLFRGLFGMEAIIALFALAVLCLVPSLLLQKGLPWVSRLGRWLPILRGERSEFYDDAVYDHLAGPRRSYLFAFSLTLASLHLLTTTLVVLPLKAAVGLRTPGSPLPFNFRGFSGTAAAMILGLALVILSPITLLRRRREEGAGKSTRPWPTDLVAVLSFFLFCLSIALAGAWLIEEPATSLFLFLRSVNWRSGVSPLAPLLFISLTGLLYTSCSLRRLRLAERRKDAPPLLNFGSASLNDVGDLENRVRNLVTFSSWELPWSVAVGIIAGFFWIVIFRIYQRQSLENLPFELFFRFTYLFLYIALLLSALRLALIWGALRSLLRRFAWWHPMERAFNALRQELPAGQKVAMAVPAQNLTMLHRSVALLDELKEKDAFIAAAYRGSSGSGPDPLQLGREMFSADLRQAKEALSKARTRAGMLSWSRSLRDGREWRDLIMKRRETQEHLSRIAPVVASALEPYWHLSDSRTPSAGRDDSARAYWTAPCKDEVPGWRDLAEKFLACRVVELIQEISAHVRNLATCVTAGLLLMLLAVASYPFRSAALFMLFNWTVVLGVVALTIFVMIQMNRNAILSALSGTAPNQVSWDRDFVLRLLVYGLLPILGLMGAQFPATLGRILPWISRLLGAQH